MTLGLRYHEIILLLKHLEGGREGERDGSVERADEEIDGSHS